MLNDLMNYQVYGGKAVGDYLSLEFLLGLAGSILGAIALLVAGFWLAGFVARRIKAIGGRHAQLDETLFNFLSNIARYAIIAFTGLIVLNTFGVQTTSVVAVIGAAGLAIGLALQGTLSNVAAGVMIIFFRPFKNGDFVEVAGKMGTVKDISLNFTELKDASGIQVIVPNSQIWGDIITNYSTNDIRRAEWTFGVGYGANLKTAEDVIRNTIMADPRSLTDPEPFIQVDNLGDFSVDFLTRVWVATPDYFAYQADMKRKVKEALDEAGIDIPFPTRTILNTAAE